MLESRACCIGNANEDLHNCVSFGFWYSTISKTSSIQAGCQVERHP